MENGDDKFTTTPDPTVYVDITNLSVEVQNNYNIPVCCNNPGPFCSMVTFCCVFTVLIPVVLLSALPSDALTANTVTTVAVMMAIIGTLYCCCLTSFPTLLKDGVCCVPKGPDRASSWKLPETTADVDVPARLVKKIKVIVNPNAGIKAGISNLSICKNIWEEKGIEVQVLETTHAGHCRKFALEEDLTGVDVLCAIGGDGTLHELVNGYLARENASRVPLGFLPGGSGNSVMCDLGTWDMAEAARRIATGNVCMMDVTEVISMGEKVASINEICFGLVGNVGIVSEHFRWMGPGRYDAVAVGQIMLDYQERVHVELEDSEGSVYKLEDNYLTCFLNQTQHFGKGLRAAPFAKLNDGLMEFYAIKAGVTTRGEALAILQQLPKGAHFEHPQLFYKQCKKIKFTFPAGPGIFNVDGENLTHNGTISMLCHKQVVPVIADPTSLAHQL